MIESFVVNIVEKLLGKLALIAIQRISFAFGLNREVRKIESTLSVIKLILLDAEEKQAQKPELGQWLGRLKDVCYDADDLLGEFEYEALWRQVVNRGSFKKKVRNSFSRSNVVVFSINMVQRIKDIRVKLDGIASQRIQLFPFLTQIEDRSALTRMPETHSQVDASEVIGRDADKENIVELLINANCQDNVFVIPIVGIGGLGKTTLAKLVNVDERVTSHFRLKWWVHVSKDFDLRKVIRDIIIVAIGTNYNDSPMEAMQNNLKQIVLGKRFLLILDDVWNVNPYHWNDLKSLLMESANGSKIIVTTRNIELAASVVGPDSIYRLQGLSPEKSVSLFEKCAFREGDKIKYPHLVKMGNEIVEKCTGVPLALKTLGSMLYTKTDEREWEKVRDNNIWKLEQKENDILTALKVSYDALPRNLKQCFSLCSIFPKKHQFNDIELIQLWIAEGLIASDENGDQELEDIGRKYIKELWSRSLFQNVEEQDFLLTFDMHDLVHELALLVAKSDCLAIDSRTNRIPERIQHLSFLVKDVPDPLVTELHNVRHLQTIQKVGTINKPFVETCIARFKCLRVLDLSDLRSQVLPSSIANMKHLRYLDLSGNCHIKILPNFICKLLNLQILKLYGCEVLEDLPKDIGNLKNLRHLLLTTRQIHLSEEGIGSLISLRHLHIAKCSILESLGEGIKRLTVLRTLVITKCKNLESLPDSLKNLHALENLAISNCNNLKLEGWAEGIQFSLRTFAVENLPELETLPQWLQGTARTLQHFRIGHCKKFAALPVWFQSLVALQKLEIINCPKLSTLPDEMNSLRALGKLTIQQCPELSRRCRTEDGQKIEHVEDVTLDP